MHEIESVFMSCHSQLEVICGPMFSGKTEELIRRIRRVKFAKMQAVVFKPEIDVRYADDLVVSHSHQKIKSVPVPNITAIKSYLKKSAKPFQVVGLDEVHFFDQDVIDFAESLVSTGIRVIAAGLCEDYLLRPFGPMPELLAHADAITKLWAVCMCCGFLASKTQRVQRLKEPVDENQVLIGADQFYEARCRSCYVRGIVNLAPKENNFDDEPILDMV
jgi:thymidine kinase